MSMRKRHTAAAAGDPPRQRGATWSAGGDAELPGQHEVSNTHIRIRLLPTRLLHSHPYLKFSATDLFEMQPHKSSYLPQAGFIKIKACT